MVEAGQFLNTIEDKYKKRMFIGFFRHIQNNIQKMIDDVYIKWYEQIYNNTQNYDNILYIVFKENAEEYRKLYDQICYEKSVNISVNEEYINRYKNILKFFIYNELLIKKKDQNTNNFRYYTEQKIKDIFNAPDYVDNLKNIICGGRTQIGGKKKSKKNKKNKKTKKYQKQKLSKKRKQ